MHLRAWPYAPRRKGNAQYMAELLGKEVAPKNSSRRCGGRCARRPKKRSATRTDTASCAKNTCVPTSASSTLAEGHRPIWRVRARGTCACLAHEYCGWPPRHSIEIHRVRNDRALCTACYVRETHVPPEVLTRLKTPGVIVSTKESRPRQDEVGDRSRREETHRGESGTRMHRETSETHDQ